MTAKTQTNRAGEVFDDAVATFNDAIRSGVKLQEEVGKWWSDALDQKSPLDDWQKKSKTVLSEAIPAAQKSAEDWLKLIEQNHKRSLALLKQALETEPTDPASIRAKSQKLWESSLELLRDNAEAIAQTNVKMMEVWAGIIRNGCAGNGKSAK
jgi:hypothetical protein